MSLSDIDQQQMSRNFQLYQSKGHPLERARSWSHAVDAIVAGGSIGGAEQGACAKGWRTRGPGWGVGDGGGWGVGWLGGWRCVGGIVVP
jgi:hypothetical protein